MTPAEFRNAIEAAWFDGYERGRQHATEDAQRDESRRSTAKAHANAVVNRFADQYGTDPDPEAPHGE